MNYSDLNFTQPDELDAEEEEQDSNFLPNWNDIDKILFTPEQLQLEKELLAKNDQCTKSTQETIATRSVGVHEPCNKNNEPYKEAKKRDNNVIVIDLPPDPKLQVNDINAPLLDSNILLTDKLDELLSMMTESSHEDSNTPGTGGGEGESNDHTKPNPENNYKQHHLPKQKPKRSVKTLLSDSLLPKDAPFLNIINSMFKENLNSFHTRSYDMLLQEHIPQLIKQIGYFKTLLEEKSLPPDDINKKIRYILHFENVTIKPSTPSPQFCHENGIHYTCDIHADAVLNPEYNLEDDVHKPRHPEHRENMLLARLVLQTGTDPDSDYDLIGVIIVRGKVRTAPCVKNVIQDFDFCFWRKDSLVCQVRSMHKDKPFRSSSTMELNIKKDVRQTKLWGVIGCKLSFACKEAHVAVLVKSLGYSCHDFNRLVKLCCGDKYQEHRFKSYEASILQNEPQTVNEAFWIISKLYKRSSLKTGKLQLQNEVLPHLKHDDPRIENQQKLFFLAMVTARLILTFEKLIPMKSRDCWSLAQITSCANHIGSLFRSQLQDNMRQAGKTCRKKLLTTKANCADTLEKIDLKIIFSEQRISSRSASAAATGIWTKNRNGVTIALNTANEAAMVLQLRQVYSPLKQTDGAHEEARAVPDDQYGFFDPANTSDGQDAGFVSELAMTATISPPTPILFPPILMALVISYAEMENNIITMREYLNNPFVLTSKHRFLMDIISAYTHVVLDVDKFVAMFRKMRRNQILYRFVFIADYKPRLVIFCREGLVSRPLIVADRIHDIKDNMTFEDCLAYGIIEYVCPQEQDTLTRIAIEPQDVNPLTTTHVEIMQGAFLGLIAGSVFFANCQQSGRLTLICSQFKQTIRGLIAKQRGQQNSAHLIYSVRNLLGTISAISRPGVTENGDQTAVVALTTRQNDQEDSIGVKKGFVERGGFLAATRLVYQSECMTPKNSASVSEEFGLPHMHYALSQKTQNYNKIDPETGVVPIGTHVNGQDMLIGKMQSIPKNNLDGHKNSLTTQSANRKQISSTPKKRCISTGLRKNCNGVVIDAKISKRPNGSMARLIVETLRWFSWADKLTTTAATKGVCSEIVPDENMPWSSLTGIIADVTMQSLGVVSRMVTSFLYCGITTKVIALYGEPKHGIDNQMYNTPRDGHMQNMGDLLVNLGFNRYGYEPMRSGITGEELGDTEIFLLPIQRLNHLCECKVHFRNSGSVDVKSRQPRDGRKNGSGARLSEMDLSVFESHGVARIAEQRFCDLSDKFSVYVCASCYLFCDDVGIDIGYSFCRRCATETKVRKCKVSFVLKVTLDHLLSLGISSELYVKDGEHMFIKPIF